MAAVAVLDASALLAYLREEPGAGFVTEVIATGASICTVNLAEALSTAAAPGAGGTAIPSQPAAIAPPSDSNRPVLKKRTDPSQ